MRNSLQIIEDSVHLRTHPSSLRTRTRNDPRNRCIGLCRVRRSITKTPPPRNKKVDPTPSSIHIGKDVPSQV